MYITVNLTDVGKRPISPTPAAIKQDLLKYTI